MANLCEFYMFVKGNIEDIKKFYNAMSQIGNIYMSRGAGAEIEIHEKDNCAYISGECKWSVSAAMVNNAISMRETPNIWAFEDGVDVSKLEFITLFEACKKWNLDMEVYSLEPGCCFQEHYMFKNSELICDECVEYFEYYVDDFETKEEAEKEYGIKISDEEWNNNEGFISCGDCGAKVGHYHHPGCDCERCPICGMQIISCDCDF